MRAFRFDLYQQMGKTERVMVRESLYSSRSCSPNIFRQYRRNLYSWSSDKCRHLGLAKMDEIYQDKTPSYLGRVFCVRYEWYLQITQYLSYLGPDRPYSHVQRVIILLENPVLSAVLWESHRLVHRWCGSLLSDIVSDPWYYNGGLDNPDICNTRGR